MRSKIKSALKSIWDKDVEISDACHTCQDRLHVYADAELEGKDAAVLFPEVKAHLNMCDRCSEDYQHLRVVLLAEREGRWVEPPVEPRFDFSALAKAARPQPAPSPRAPQSPGESRRLIIKFSASLFSLQRPLALASIPVKSTRSSKTLLELPLEEKANDLEVGIAVEERKDNAAICTIFVDVNIPSRGGWPNLDGTEVTLKRGEATLAAHPTDVFGKVVFEDIATDDLTHLVFEITPRA